MNPEDVKALIDHMAADAEGIAQRLGHSNFTKVIEGLKSAAENPLILGMVVMAINFGLSHLAAQAADAKPAQAS